MRVEHIGDATPCVRIYALCEYPDIPRYVGKTVQFIGNRHKAHIRAAKRGSNLPVHRWLRRQIAENAWLTIKLLEFVDGDADWASREAHWIGHFRSSGANLLNLTSGGEGLPGHRFSAAHKMAIASALKRGATFNCEVCDKSFWRKPKDIRKGHNKFCSRRCSNARHKGKDLFS